jgi:hypothetical protein
MVVQGTFDEVESVIVERVEIQPRDFASACI